MKLQIEHTTLFTYDEPISEAYTEMRLRPLEVAGQRCLSFRLSTEPGGDARSYTDRFGNQVHHFDALQPHKQVIVTAISEVDTATAYSEPHRELPLLDRYDYLATSPYCPDHDTIADFARPLHVPAHPAATAEGLMNALFTSLKYEPGATDVKTTAPEALQLGRGVCQDFAHVMLTACRSLDLPARYVSGYLYNPGLLEARRETGVTVPTNAASHAWVDVFIEGSGWLSFDPTHNCQQTDEYVHVAVGRDYADVPPTRGVYKGNARETLTVKVGVRTF